MGKIFLTHYTVRGIKNLEKPVSMSFSGGIKGITGPVGCGKSGIILSVGILKNLLVNPGFLYNPVVQKNLDAVVNKKSRTLEIEAQFRVKTRQKDDLYRYQVALAKTGKYQIKREEMDASASGSVFSLTGGEVDFRDDADPFSAEFWQKTQNLRSDTGLCALFRTLYREREKKEALTGDLFSALSALSDFGESLCVCARMFSCPKISREAGVFPLSPGENVFAKDLYGAFAKSVDHLYGFLHFFKPDLTGIEITRKEDRERYHCGLVLVYDGYKIPAGEESTGIQRLIRLYASLRESALGGIAFVDDLDLGLYEPHVRAILEWMEKYGQGQLCYTAHRQWKAISE